MINKGKMIQRRVVGMVLQTDGPLWLVVRILSSFFKLMARAGKSFKEKKMFEKVIFSDRYL